VARNGPPDDFHNQPTQSSNFGAAPPPPLEATAEGESPQFVDPLDGPEPTPWYRKPGALAAWIAAVVVLIGLIVFGVMELLRGGQGTGTTPSTSTSTTPSPTTTTTPPTTTTTTTTTTPPTSATVETPAQQPTYQPTRQPTQQPTHRHHLPALPSVITIPEVPTVITLPPGLS